MFKITFDEKIGHKIISKMIPENSSILDLGCGDGSLLELLKNEKHVKGQGIEIDEKMIYRCVEKGQQVIHGNLDDGLIGYSQNSFDFVIINQSLQEVKNIVQILDDSLRVGRYVIVGISNFAHFSIRLHLFLHGRLPINPLLQKDWYDSPNRHFFSIIDFVSLCKENNYKIIKKVFIGYNKLYNLPLPNLFATRGIFLIANR